MILRPLVTCLLLIVAISLQARQKLDFQVFADFQYVLKLHQSESQLIRSSDPNLAPWLPARQYGWMFRDQETFDEFFEHLGQGTPRFDFDQQLVLAMIRHDPWLWDMQVEAVWFDAKTTQVGIESRMKEVGDQRPSAVTSVRIIVIDLNKKMKSVGVRNLSFTLEERIPAHISSLFPYQEMEGTQYFPEAYQLADLQSLLSYYRDVLQLEGLPGEKSSVEDAAPKGVSYSEMQASNLNPKISWDQQAYLVIDNANRWLQLFRELPQGITHNDFENQFALVILKRGDWELGVDAVFTQGQVLYLEMGADPGKALHAKHHSGWIVWIDRVPYRMLDIRENGLMVPRSSFH
ncbi:hypothetical protein [Pontibacter sp. G13]|uniref:hypothetical protein n=1 Tax=Pontibacter sp. G13 TaxID=3074898 RepID=UPI00288B2A22|nr:hypothetical protein [Pontibacter sp. G13]WNJ17513.1 hypothetical protein RJD25_21910 [Pontibacter sp. G13]